MSVTRIGRAAFMGCERLISLELPEELESIHLDQEWRPDEDPHDDPDENPDDPHYDPAIEANPLSIDGCRSLVNLVLPSGQEVREFSEVGELAMDNFKLRTVIESFDDLVDELQDRFDDLPMHRLCYYQSYHSLTEVVDNMVMDASLGTKVDAFGMTPFHILALSQTPNLSLLLELRKVHKVDIFHTRDKFGSTPMDYLCLNPTPEATNMIQSLLPMIFAKRLRSLGLARWTSDMLAAMEEALTTEWSSRRNKISLLYFKLATYERLEAMSLLELALWKVKMDGCSAPNDDTGNEESSPKSPRLDISHLDGVDRQSCRINSGADVVISNVLPFLDILCREDYIASEPSTTRTMLVLDENL
jgi:hypothetical protein